MAPRTVLGLAVVTVLVSVAAIIVAVGRQVPAPVHYVDRPAFPTLREQPDAVAKVTIRTADGVVTLTRKGGNEWQAAERYDYPAADDKIRKLVVQLADMRLIEAKTDRAERYPRLEVEDVAKGAKSRHVRLEAADGKVLAEAIIGKRRYRLTGTEPAGTYLRLQNEARSWLASGGLELDSDVPSWLDQELVNVNRDDVQRVEILPAGAERYVVSRTAKEAEPKLEGLAQGQSLSKDANLNQLFSALTSVTLTDVKPRAEFKPPKDLHTAKITTFDGLEVTIQLALIDDKPWALLDARTAPVPNANADQTAAAEKQAQAIAARPANWAYQVNQSLYQRLTKPKDSWLATSDSTS